MSGQGTAGERHALYVGAVMHHRLRPVRHRFVYQVFWLLLDLDRLDQLERRSWLLGIERRRPLSFRARDHGGRDGQPLRPWVEAELTCAGHLTRPATILLLCFPRVLGYGFNPLGIYYCLDERGQLTAAVLEVSNTFGGRHVYVLRPAGPQAGPALRDQHAKTFYVSPFIEMDALYRFKLTPPGARLEVVVREDAETRPLLRASLTARRRALSGLELARAFLRTPLLTWKVIAGIHLEALRLWLKGVRVHPLAGSPGGGRQGKE